MATINVRRPDDDVVRRLKRRADEAICEDAVRLLRPKETRPTKGAKLKEGQPASPPARQPASPPARQPAAGSLSRSLDSPAVDPRHGDCLTLLPGLDAAGVHPVVTDPPYFLDGLAPRATGTVGGLPARMRFDPRQGAALQAFVACAGAAATAPE